MHRNSLYRFAVAGALSGFVLAGPSFAAEDPLAGMSVFLEIYQRSADAPPVLTRRTPLFEDYAEFPEGKSWFIRVLKNPPASYSPGDMKALVRFLAKAKTPGLSFEYQKMIGDAELSALKHLDGLEWLNLSGTNVTSGGMQFLRSLRSLRAIGVSHTKVSVAAIQDLEKSLGHALEPIPPGDDAQRTNPEDKVTASGVHYFDFGASPEPVIEGTIPRGKMRMDYQWTLYTLDDRPANISEQKGKVLFLYFWATTSSPCLEELPTIDDLSVALKNSHVFFACVSQETPAVVQAFLKWHPTKVPIFVMKEWPSGSGFAHEVPSTYIVAPAGDVVVHHVGSRNWNTQDVMNYLLRLKTDKKPSHP
jgi:thiol-disulfide isomerase/thioredoxin